MAGYRTFADLERLDGDALNNYIMAQLVPRFIDAADRDAQMGGVVPGQLSYLIDPGVFQKVAPGTTTWVNLIPDAYTPPAAPPAGVATLVAGTVVVPCPGVLAASRIWLTAQQLGTVTVPSALGISARTDGVSFTIAASQPTDTSTVAWRIE